jgi:hypothetical protein
MEQVVLNFLGVHVKWVHALEIVQLMLIAMTDSTVMVMRHA